MADLLHDIRAAFLAAITEWRRCRWLRSGTRCPDECPF